MTSRREFLRSTAGTGVAAVASMASVHSAAAAVTAAKPKTQAASSYTQQLEAARVAAGVTGASFAYWDGEQLHTAASGLRNSVTGDPVTVDTVMFIGSVTKVLNTALMMQAVDDGKIALDDPAIKHVPELRLRDKQALQRITCQMLVNHTNGIDGEWLPEFGPDRERIVDCIDRCADLGQVHAPGEAASYSNIGHVIAGYLSQRVFKDSWYTLMKARIFEPLGMTHSLVDPLDVPRFRVSTGDITDYKTGKLVQSPKSFLAPSLSPAGATMMMTASDLVTFARAMMNGGMGVGPNGKRILSEASAARMAQKTAAFVPMSSPTDIGLGWWLLPGGVLSHAGGGRGVHARLYAHPASGRAMALLMNSPGAMQVVESFMDPIVATWTGIKPQKRQPMSGPADPRPYIGVYENNLTHVEVIAHEGGLGARFGAKIDGLQNVNKSAPPSKLIPMGDDLFEAAVIPGSPNLELKFVQPGSDGRMRYASAFMRLYPRTA
ncbi:MAG TPA: serine hydrolase domain-containing protein [Steroidobacter sp.]|uniref:serine hydrolase domain-containing protein n=1 Tax=Steroidobacter sp. TaxID=1978227 RepID=UPI002ED89864